MQQIVKCLRDMVLPVIVCLKNPKEKLKKEQLYNPQDQM